MSSSFGTLLPSGTHVFPVWQRRLQPSGAAPAGASPPPPPPFDAPSAPWTWPWPSYVGHLTAAGLPLGDAAPAGRMRMPPSPPPDAAAFRRCFCLPLLPLLVKAELRCVSLPSPSPPPFRLFLIARTIPRTRAPRGADADAHDGIEAPALLLRLGLGLGLPPLGRRLAACRRRAGRPRRPGSWALGSGACPSPCSRRETTRSRRERCGRPGPRGEFSIRHGLSHPRTRMPLAVTTPGGMAPALPDDLSKLTVAKLRTRSRSAALTSEPQGRPRRSPSHRRRRRERRGPAIPKSPPTKSRGSRRAAPRRERSLRARPRARGAVARAQVPARVGREGREA